MSRSLETKPGTSAFGAVDEQHVDTGVAQSREPVQVGDATVEGQLVHLRSPVCSTTPAAVRIARAIASGIEWLTARNSTSQGPSTSALAVGRLGRLQLEPVLTQLGLDEGEGQPRAEHRDVAAQAQEVRQCPMWSSWPCVRTTASMSPSRSVMGPKSGRDQVDARRFSSGKAPAVDDQQATIALEHGHVAADLAEAAEREDAQGSRCEGRRGGELGVAHAVKPRTPPTRGPRAASQLGVGRVDEREPDRTGGQALQLSGGLGQDRRPRAEAADVDGQQRGVDVGAGLLDPSGPEGLGHVLQRVTDEVVDDRDHPGGSEREQGQVEYVVAEYARQARWQPCPLRESRSPLASLLATMRGCSAIRNDG